MVEGHSASTGGILDLEVDGRHSSRALALLVLHDLHDQHHPIHWTVLVVGIVIDHSDPIRLQAGHVIDCGSAEGLNHAPRPFLGALARQLPEYHPPLFTPNN